MVLSQLYSDRMKNSLPVVCPSCGEQFAQGTNGSQLPEYVDCPKCHARIYNVSPLGNFVTSLLMHRAHQELDKKDVTLAIILSAVAVEGQMAYLFFKWKKVDSFTFDIAKQWEKDWTEMRSISKRMDELSKFLTGISFDSFAQQKKILLESAIGDGHDPATSFRDFLQEQFFERRNEIVHYGEIDFQESDGKLSLTLASSLISLLNAMDQQRIAQMDIKHKKTLNSLPPE
jgi:DNA-directed RNA polymerase subunit RPC12/RpoP